MDLAIVLNGVVLDNVSIGDGYIQADCPMALTLSKADMTKVYVTQSTDGRHNTLVINLSGGVRLHLVYPIPPSTECHACHTLIYHDTLEYVSESLVNQYPSLAEHRYHYLCKACLGLHIDDAESTLV